MYKTTIALAVVAGVAFSAPAAQACVDDAPCPSRIPYTRFIPRGLPDIPDIPKGVPKVAIPKAAIPKAPPKVIDRKIESKTTADEAPRPAAKAVEADVKVVEKPDRVRAPEPARVCTKYLPSLGRAVEIPCE